MKRHFCRDVMLATVRGEVPKQIPYSAVMPDIYFDRWKETLGRDPEEIYHLDPVMKMVTPRMRGRDITDLPFERYEQPQEEYREFHARFSKYLPKELPAGTRITEYGVATVPGSMYHLRRPIHPLAGIEKVSELDEYPSPDLFEEWRWEGLAEEARRFREEDYLVMGGVPSLFESAWYMRGQEEMLVDLALGSEIAQYLLDWMARTRSTISERLARMEIDIIGLADDLGTQHGPLMSREMMRRSILPAYEKVISAAKTIKPSLKFIMHTDGENHTFLADLMAVGVDGITPVQPELDDPRMLKEKFGRRLILWGTVSTHGMSFGSPNEVEREVEMRMAIGKEFGGLILGPNNVIDVNTAFENLVRYHDAAEKYGRL